MRLVVQYDGTGLFGFQRQTRGDRPTVQGHLEEALGKLTGRPTRVVGAGRTDAGAHALGQVAHFRTSSPVPASRLPEALNRLLPPCIRVVASEEAPPGFHARRDARSRIYCYHILNRRKPSALAGRFSWWVDQDLDVELMGRLARRLRGRRDFRAFGTPLRPGQSGVRTVFDAAVDRLALARGGQVVRLCMEADAYLFRMVRLVVGALVRAGLGRLSEEEWVRALEGAGEARATRSGPTRLAPAAPAHGLCLVHVNYRPEPSGLEVCAGVLDTLIGLWLECPRGFSAGFA